MVAGGRVRVEASVFERFPGYRALAVHADDLAPAGDHAALLLREAVATARARHDGSPPSAHPHIAAWRSAYSAFGAKPSRFHNSAEALLRRAVRDGVPSITPLVDLYNAVSIAHVLPVGGEDRDRLAGEVVLRFAEGCEPFETVEAGEPVEQPVAPGEVVWRDRAGVTCRRWNWRQCTRTALREGSSRALFLFDALPPYSDGELDAAVETLTAGLRAVAPGCRLAVERIEAR